MDKLIGTNEVRKQIETFNHRPIENVNEILKEVFNMTDFADNLTIE